MLRNLILGLAMVFCSVSLFADDAKTEPKQVERTLALVKPDGVASNHIGDIISRYEKGGLVVIALKMTQLTQTQAQQFYAVHESRPFFKDLTTYMSSGPIVAIVLEGDNAVAKVREINGATDPQKAAKGTIRADFAKSVTQNAVHSSDSKENATKEISFFFQPQNFYSR